MTEPLSSDEIRRKAAELWERCELGAIRALGRSLIKIDDLPGLAANTVSILVSRPEFGAGGMARIVALLAVQLTLLGANDASPEVAACRALALADLIIDEWERGIDSGSPRRDVAATGRGPRVQFTPEEVELTPEEMERALAIAMHWRLGRDRQELRH